MAQPREDESNYLFGYYGNSMPLEILENALEIALNDNDRARAHYLMAMTLRNQSGDYRRLQRVPEEFEAALSAGRANKWYDDALYHYAVWMANQGRIKAKDYGRWQPDYVKARELYRRLVTEYTKGETRYYDQALATPANQPIEYEIHDPRGTLVKRGKAELNPFGSAWGSLELTERMPLGEYRISFPVIFPIIGNIHTNNPTLFRLEEYKLPEFQVSVRTPEENGLKKSVQLGDRIEVKVQLAIEPKHKLIEPATNWLIKNRRSAGHRSCDVRPGDSRQRR
jgi:hypothetical protein